MSAKTYGDSPFTLTATASSYLAVTYVSSNSAVATVSGRTVTITGAGTCTITASQAGDYNYGAAADVARTLKVNKANQVLTLDPLPVNGQRLDQLIGTALTVTASSSSGLAVTIALGSGSPATLTQSGGSYSLTTTNSTGIITVIVSQAGPLPTA